MTYSEFRYSLTAGIFRPRPRTIVINYNPIIGSNPLTATIDDIAILIEGNLTQLQEATLISLTIPQTNGVVVNINVESSTNPVRVVDRGPVGLYYCYSIITPDQRPVIQILPSGDPEGYDTDVVIEPVTATGAYNYNTYNPLIGNTITDRESSYRVHSDRGTSATNPINLDSIIANRAIPATVQDSLYSDTGWIQGRYEGTKLTPLNNNNTDPILPGTFFEGAFFSIDTSDAYITALQPTELTYTQYLSSGKSEVPRYEIQDLGLSVSSPSPQLEGTLLTVLTPSSISPKLINLSIGDLLVVSSSAKLEDEVMLIQPPTRSQQYFPYEFNEVIGGLENKEIRVLRGYADTVKFNLIENYPNGPLLFKLSKVKLYSIEGTVVQAVTAGKVLVKETGEILRVSSEGLVIGGNTMVEL